MLDLATVQDAGDWDRFRPVGEDTFEQEAFAPWWARHCDSLRHLHSDVCKQWIFRHWRTTRHRWLDPQLHVSHEQILATDAFLGAVYLHWGGPADAECDYDVFRPDKQSPLPTAMEENWANGTWVLPPVLLETPDGVKFHAEEYPDKRYLVVEGAKRFRWLNALAHRGDKTGPHRCYVLKLR